MKVQLSGASGFIGSNLIKLLDFEFSPIKINLKSHFSIHADIFIHLAGISQNKNCSISKDKYFEINTELTKKVFDAFLLSNAKKFILISSVKAIRDEYNLIITENTLECPNSNYGRSKLDADKYILSKIIPEDKAIYILRPSLVTGCGVRGNMLKLFNLSNSPYNWLFSSINNQRTYCNILNLSFVIQQLIDRDDISPGVYLVADNESLSTGEIINELSFKKLKCNFLSSFLYSVFYLVIVLDNFFGNISLFSSLRALMNNYVVSNKKIVEALGNPLPFTALDGIRLIKNN